MAQSIYSFDQWLAQDTQDPAFCGRRPSSRYRPRREGWIPCAGTRFTSFNASASQEEVRRLEEQLKTEFPAYTIVRSADFLLEVMAPGVSKASAVRRACALWQLPVEASAAFWGQLQRCGHAGGSWLRLPDGKQPQALLDRFPLHAPDNEHDGVYHGIVRLGLVQEEDQPGQAE